MKRKLLIDEISSYYRMCGKGSFYHDFGYLYEKLSLERLNDYHDSIIGNIAWFCKDVINEDDHERFLQAIQPVSIYLLGAPEGAFPNSGAGGDAGAGWDHYMLW